MRWFFALLFLVSSGVPLAKGQPVTAPSVNAAEQAFDRGLRAFRAEQYSVAYDAFMRAATEFDFNQRTTAAYLMAGKARYAAGDLEGTASVMSSLISTYPRSRYVEEAREIRRDALSRLRGQPAEVAVTTIGVALPLSSQDLVFTQTLFNGVRLAIDDHNAANPDRPIRIVFRDSGGSPTTAAAATAELARAGVNAAIGPLYSEEAVAAAAVAERERLVLITPLATDEEVTANRRFTFQANPTFPARGRLMARHVLEQRHRHVGVVAVSGTLAANMADAFTEAYEAGGGTILFNERLPSGEAWFQLPERVAAEHLAQVDAVYFPITGAGADEYAAGALRGLDQMLETGERRPRVYGNAEWQNLRGSRPRARQYGAVFTNDFYQGSETANHRSFVNRYRDLSGVLPDRIAFKGYDVGLLLLAALENDIRGESLANALRRMPAHRGLAHLIDFRGSQANQHLFLLRFGVTDVELVR
jgi:branched-chain amino acid transport system substrate-binding protein